MAKRFGLSRGRSRKMFSRNAMRTRRANVSPIVMRGGIRL